MKHISVIGSGTMGNGIAHVFAQHGYSVSLVDVSDEALKKGLATIEKNLARQVEKGTITEAVKDQSLGNITLHNTVKAGVERAELVVEAATENTDLQAEDIPGPGCCYGSRRDTGHQYIVHFHYPYSRRHQTA